MKVIALSGSCPWRRSPGRACTSPSPPAGSRCRRPERRPSRARWGAGCSPPRRCSHLWRSQSPLLPRGLRCVLWSFFTLDASRNAAKTLGKTPATRASGRKTLDRTTTKVACHSRAALYSSSRVHARSQGPACSAEKASDICAARRRTRSQIKKGTGRAALTATLRWISSSTAPWAWSCPWIEAPASRGSRPRSMTARHF